MSLRPLISAGIVVAFVSAVLLWRAHNTASPKALAYPRTLPAIDGMRSDSTPGHGEPAPAEGTGTTRHALPGAGPQAVSAATAAAKAPPSAIRPTTTPAPAAPTHKHRMLGAIDKRIVSTPESRPHEIGSSSDKPAPIAHMPILDLDPGVQLPAILLDDAPARTPQIQQAKDNLAATFHQELQQEIAAIPDDDEQSFARAYHRARMRSDELYRALFGDAAYQNQAIQKATEAVTAHSPGKEAQ